MIPAEAIFEPKYDDLARRPFAGAYSSPARCMGIAGIYTKWRSPEGLELFSFAMLTVNTGGHPVMAQFHKPGDEKRMVVILEPADYDRWLSPTDRGAKFLQAVDGAAGS